ncbi:GAF domain-containing sensor histidine kinase [Pedobacter caeni]|uniref:histidine kinase n=1 Tax=Pedobacter caeni TaxID=288992 RepID=A0A1M5HGH5_9SPHI|nr:GAF domain-containing sensor histidine kinase [Pedobacter caeni]SHG15074.1 hypothetical protein SAMN04488522_104654 [Pedobacter caeni]
MVKSDNLSPDLLQDIEDISRIPVVSTILEVICLTTGMGFAAIARVTEDKWVACSVKDDIQFGLTKGGELKLESTICHEIRQTGKEVVIDHVSDDRNFSAHHTPKLYGFESYISIPIVRKDGSFFGTLCAIDPKPAKLNNPQIIGMFKLYADLISFHLNALDKISITESNLIEERKSSELREQFIAILGHDLRNPLSAVYNSAQMLMRLPLEDRPQRLVRIIKDSAHRMTGLIENVLDLARGRMGDGISVSKNNDQPMQEILEEVISEFQAISPARIIKTEYHFEGPVHCDGMRIAQLFSNLLGNAITHGLPETPIRVRAKSNLTDFSLSITNFSEKIPEEAMAQLFQPFSRGKVKPGQEGLGLGLYISAEIARAHRGKLEVVSNDKETCFTLRIPVNPVVL